MKGCYNVYMFTENNTTFIFIHVFIFLIPRFFLEPPKIHCKALKTILNIDHKQKNHKMNYISPKYR